MPRQKGGVNKSAAIRELYTQNPNAPVKEVIATLGERGIKVKPTLVYYIKNRMRQARRKQMRQKVTRATGLANPVDLIVKIKSLAKDAGGLAKLKQLVDVLAE